MAAVVTFEVRDHGEQAHQACANRRCDQHRLDRVVADVVGGVLAGVLARLAQLLAAFAQGVHAAVRQVAGVVSNLVHGGAGVFAGAAQAIQALLGQFAGVVAEGFGGGVHGVLSEGFTSRACRCAQRERHGRIGSA